MKRLIFTLLALIILPTLAIAGGPLPGALNPGTISAAGGATKIKANLVSASHAALASNLLDHPVNGSAATLAVASTAPTLTGYTNLIPAFGDFSASHTFNTTTGSNVLTNYTFSSGLALSALEVGMPVVERSQTGSVYPPNIPLGAVITSIDTVGNTITMSKPATGTATSIFVGFWPRQIRALGGVVGSVGQSACIVMGTVGNSVTPPTAQAVNGVPEVFEFYTDAANFSTSSAGLILRDFTSGVTPNAIRIAIDDAYLTAGTTAMSVSGTNYISITFAATGVHKVRVEMPAGALLSGLYYINGSKQWSPDPKPRALIFTDSYGNGGGAGSFGPNNLFHQLCIRMGWECYNAAVGGTGYVSNGGSNYNWADPFRLRDLQIIAPEILLFGGSLNDGAASAGAVSTNATTVWSAARALYPNIPIVIFGISATTTATGGYPTQENALSSAFTAWGDGNAWFFPQFADPEGPWISTSNNGLYIYSGDNAHPSYALSPPSGTDYFARRMADKIRNIVIPSLTR